MFRTLPVGIVDQEGRVLHFRTLPQYVPDLVMELLDRVKSSDVHMLIRSCVFHYEFELIHPFADENGRIGRLWQNCSISIRVSVRLLSELILSSWQTEVPLFTPKRKRIEVLSSVFAKPLFWCRYSQRSCQHLSPQI